MKTAAPLSRIESVFRAFSDPTRLRILNLLRDPKELCVCDLIDVLDLPQAKISRHLAYLRRAGLVQTRREGQWIYYRLSKPEGSFHTQLLDCLKTCQSLVPEFKADLQRLRDCGKRCC